MAVRAGWSLRHENDMLGLVLRATPCRFRYQVCSTVSSEWWRLIASQQLVIYLSLVISKVLSQIDREVWWWDSIIDNSWSVQESGRDIFTGKLSWPESVEFANEWETQDAGDIRLQAGLLPASTPRTFELIRCMIRSVLPDSVSGSVSITLDGVELIGGITDDDFGATPWESVFPSMAHLRGLGLHDLRLGTLPPNLEPLWFSHLWSTVSLDTLRHVHVDFGLEPSGCEDREIGVADHLSWFLEKLKKLSNLCSIGIQGLDSRGADFLATLQHWTKLRCLRYWPVMSPDEVQLAKLPESLETLGDLGNPSRKVFNLPALTGLTNLREVRFVFHGRTPVADDLDATVDWLTHACPALRHGIIDLTQAENLTETVVTEQLVRLVRRSTVKVLEVSTPDGWDPDCISEQVRRAAPGVVVHMV